MDWNIFILGSFVGSLVFDLLWRWSRRLERKLIKSQRELIEEQGNAVRAAFLRLAALRRNAFLTNEHGHRVRYHKASAEVRARAEAE